MAHYIGNKIGVSKDIGLLDLYSVNVNGKADGAYVGFPGSQYSLQDGNQNLGGAHVVGGFQTDPTDGLAGQRGSGTYRYHYNGEPGTQHNDMDIFTGRGGASHQGGNKIQEKPEPAIFYGG